MYLRRLLKRLAFLPIARSPLVTIEIVGQDALAAAIDRVRCARARDVTIHSESVGWLGPVRDSSAPVEDPDA